ncbi:MAG: polysulfide reductase NrfD [Deltaproteobacteria bacterium]|nr:polysulfide reductase NrfD [Deltaproteobacteria bacterium]
METESKTAVIQGGENVPDTGTLKGFIAFFLQELKPKGKLITPFNVITGIIIVVGLALIVLRFWKGLGAVTNLSQDYPWGIWIGFDVVTGVAFAGGAYVLCFVVHILKVEKYEPIVRATVLNGFLAYVFYSGALLLDLGRPWNVVNPIIGNAFGYGSVLFLVAWHFLLYTICLFLETAPAITEWLGWPKVRRILLMTSTATVILGVTLSTLHQAGLGALFLSAPAKIHPLWYSANIPVLFFISSMFAGFSMIIIESMFTHKVFSHRVKPGHEASHDNIILGLGKGSASVMAAYLFLKIIDLTHHHQWGMLFDSMGLWYLVEVVGFTLVPMVLYVVAIRDRNVKLVQITAFLTAFGVILNRLNISVIAFKWYEAVRYYPSWQEVWVTLAVISMELWVFRWVINRMPILGEHPDYKSEGHTIHSKKAEVAKWTVSAS